MADAPRKFSGKLGIIAARLDIPDIGSLFCQMCEIVKTLRQPFPEPGQLGECLITIDQTIKQSFDDNDKEESCFLG
jgi:hypothetical protein